MIFHSPYLAIILQVFLIHTLAFRTEEALLDSRSLLAKRESYIICPAPLPPAGVDYPAGYSPKNFHDLTELCQDAGCQCGYDGKVVCERSPQERYGATAPELYDKFQTKCRSRRWCHCMLPGNENRVPIAGNIFVPGYTDVRGPGSHGACLAGISDGWSMSENSCCKGSRFLQQKLVNAAVQFGTEILGTVGSCQLS